MKLNQIAAMLFVGLLGAAAGYFLAQRSRSSPPAPLLKGASGPGQVTHVMAEGRLEPAGGVLQLGVLPGEKISQVCCSEGQQVEKDQVLIELESNELYSIEYKLADARLQAAQKQLGVEQDLARARKAEAALGLERAQLADLDIAAQNKKLELGEAQEEKATLDLQRLSDLRENERTQKFVAKQQVEQQELLRDQASSELQRGRMALEAAEKTNVLTLASAQNALLIAGLAEQQVDAANPCPTLELARDAAEQRMQLSTLKAPIAGQVLRLMAREGEHVGNLPLLQLADLSQMVCVAEVYDAQVQFLRDGDAAVITSPALASELTGHVERIGEIVGDPDFRSPDPLALQDRHTVRVRISLDEPSRILASRLVHLRVQVRIAPSGQPAAVSQNPGT